MYEVETAPVSVPHFVAASFCIECPYWEYSGTAEYKNNELLRKFSTEAFAWLANANINQMRLLETVTALGWLVRNDAKVYVVDLVETFPSKTKKKLSRNRTGCKKLDSQCDALKNFTSESDSL